MSEILLKINGLHASIGDKEILKGIDLEIRKGEIHAVMGPNGAGKSTLSSVLTGKPQYEVTAGSIEFDGRDLLAMSPEERSWAGIFMSFQNPVEIPGITLSDFLRNALEQVTGQRMKLWDFKKQLKAAMDVLNMDAAYADRDLNAGFSGGEKKKAEILQLLMLKPKLAILDETDSGLDVDAVKTVSAGIAAYRETCGGSLLIITHNSKILDALTVDRTHVIADGRIVKEGGAELKY